MRAVVIFVGIAGSASVSKRTSQCVQADVTLVTSAFFGSNCIRPLAAKCLARDLLSLSAGNLRHPLSTGNIFLR